MGSKEMDAWKACGAVISSPKFQVPLDAFLDSNCEQFTEDEENKLEYTAIHGQYESLIEEKLRDGLCERLGSAFDWDAFLLQLPAYIEKITGAEVGQGQEAAGHEDDELSANTLGVLYSFIDFAQFKATMLLRKRSKLGEAEGRGGKQELAADDVALNEELDSMVRLLEDGGWETILKKPDLIVDTARNSKGILTVRFVLECGMPRAAALDMYTNLTEERKHWDSYTIWKDHGTHQEVSVKMPLMKPMAYKVKFAVKDDHPGPGSTVFGYRAVKHKTGELDYSSGAPCGKGVIKDTPDGGCTLTSVEELPSLVNYMPKFMLHWFITSVTPSVLYGMLTKYKKYKGL